MVHQAARKTLFLLLSLILAAGILPLLAFNRPAVAAEVTNRSVTVSSSLASVVTSHNFKFNFISTSNIGSITFLYCDNTPLIGSACNAPAGLNVSAATLTGQTGNTGFGIDTTDTTNNQIVLTRASAPAAAVASSYDFANITNPSTSDRTVFVRITTYASADGSGSYTDYGSVAFATNSPFSVSTTVPPFVNLCAGVTVASDCSSTSGDHISMGSLSISQAKTATSQFAGATNSTTGYAVYLLGTTMTSGNNFIPALSTPTASKPGTSQFGINLTVNTGPAVGQGPSGAGTASPTVRYGTANRFTFVNGDMVASSGIPSEYNRMTVSYLANIGSSQPGGVYSTTITFLATGTF